MIKDVLSVLGGVVVGNVIFLLFQLVGYAVSPDPVGFDPSKMSYTREVVDAMPFYAWLILFAGYAAGAIVGGFIVGKYAESKSRVFPVILAIFFILGWLVNIVRIPHPLWAIVFVFLIFVPLALFGHRLSTKRSAEAGG